MGIFVGLLNALSVGLLDVFIKKLSGVNPNFLTWARMLAAVPVLAVLVTVFHQWAIPPLAFWFIVGVIAVPLELVLAYIGTKAIQIAPLSLIAPLGAFTSLFLIPVGYVVLGELPTRVGLAGVALIVIGSFFLGWRMGERHLRQGLGDILREPGSWLALSGAFIASVTVTLAKFTFRYTTPLLAAFYTTSLEALLLIPLVVAAGALPLARFKLRHIGGLMAMAGSGIALHYTGLSLLPAVYYISVKRTSTVINVLWGRLFFHEDHTRERLIGAALMLIGVLLIAVG